MNIKNITPILLTILLFSAGITSCKKKGCTDSTAINYDEKAKKDDNSCEYETDHNEDGYHIQFQFTHNYGGAAVTASDFNNLNYTNEAGNNHSISKLRYLISDIRLYKSNGDSVMIDGYQLVDLSDNNSLVFSAPEHITVDTYTGIGFNFGFDGQDNTTGVYADLNAATWSWPAMLGGGYHFLQFEGNFIDASSATTGFAYHMGTAREITATDTTFHENHFLNQLANSGFTLSADASIEIKMDIAEWFKTPTTWDLNTYNSMLMPNFTAQQLMNDNGRSVFSIGTITQ